MDFDRIRTFVKSYIREDDSDLSKLYDDAVRRGVPVIREDTADYLKVLLAGLKPERILEVGTAVGYSALFMAVYLGGATSIDTIELDLDMADEAEANFRRFKKDDVITLHRGDAAEILEDMAEQGGRSYDLVFIDAAKSHYMRFLEATLKVMRPGSIILVDDTLFQGRPALDPE